MSLASGAKYAALAEVPGLRIRTFLAFGGPTFSRPTLSSRFGVPGAAKPCIQLNRVAADAVGVAAPKARAIAAAASQARAFGFTGGTLVGSPP